MPNPTDLVPTLLAWWDAGHADLPWRRTKDAYAVWVAEIMLQQTQIATVLPYYARWMTRFPTVEALADAPLDDVLKLWEGLGYYSRARNLHTAARQIMAEHDGRLPDTLDGLVALPGIGRYTAGAIASIAFAIPAPVLDGNVIRVLSRIFDINEDVTKPATRKWLWELAAAAVPTERPGDFNQALMEMGQLICTPQTPRCLICPVNTLCLARQRGTQLERPVRPARKPTPHYDVGRAVPDHPAAARRVTGWVMGIPRRESGTGRDVGRRAEAGNPRGTGAGNPTGGIHNKGRSRFHPFPDHRSCLPRRLHRRRTTTRGRRRPRLGDARRSGSLCVCRHKQENH